MLDLFLNPGYLAAGAALVSLPIIIHLINRMRFKRIRWAAMEFLLKAQKRNRRRLIIEQLILLALRCFLVLLAVLLVSRYLGFSFAFENQATLHVVLVDDTPSMKDQWREEGETRDSFHVAKDLIMKEIARNAVQARTPQRLALIFLSEPNTVRFDQRLNDQTLPELQRALDDADSTWIRTDLLKGVEGARALFDKVPQDKRVLHVVSDFRQPDWSEPDVDGTRKALDDLAKSGVKINLVDAAHPFRNDLQKTPLAHDNLSIVELRPETRVAAKDQPVLFTVRVANHGASERKNVRVSVKVNGGERLEASATLVSIPPGGSTTDTFYVVFNELGFNQVSGNLENEEAGLQGDNIRYAVVDVRPSVPVLLVDGDPTNGLKPGGDTYHIQTLLTATPWFRVVQRGVIELEQPTLDQYSCIYILNVRSMSEKALKNLENFIRDGGNVAFFLGERVDPEYYNKYLYAKGKGIFPAPLAAKPNPPISEPEYEADLMDGQSKIIVRDEENPIFADVWNPRIRPVFRFLPIKRYFPVPRRTWELVEGETAELVTLPNQKEIRDYAGEGQGIVEALNGPISDPKVEKFRPGLERHQRNIRAILAGGKALYELANALDALLKDRGDPKDPQQPNLVEFWNQSDYQRLKGQIAKFQKDVQLGDPLVVTHNYGRGRVIAFLTSAGRSWSDWAGGSMASPTYPVVMLELQKYLTSGGSDTSLIVGNSLEIQLDSSRFDNKMHRSFQRESAEKGPGGAAKTAPPAEGPEKNAGIDDLKDQLGTVSNGRVTFDFTEAKKPGLYRFDFMRLGGDAVATARPEQRAYAFNIDPKEGELRRSATDELERLVPGGVQVRNPGSGWGAELANRQSDLSESPWFYLLFLAILVVEQALAVHLSFHVKGSDTLPGPNAKPASAA